MGCPLQDKIAKDKIEEVLKNSYVKLKGKSPQSEKGLAMFDNDSIQETYQASIDNKIPNDIDLLLIKVESTF